MAKAKESYSQIGYLAVTESAANTLTFNGLSVFSNVLGQKGMIIHRADYAISSTTLGVLAASQDGFQVGLAGSDALTTIALDDPEVYDYVFLSRRDYGTAASALILQFPIKRDFTQLPGGGLLVPADRLYGYFEGVNLSNPGGVTIRFWYTIIDLSAADYLELAQSMRVLK